MSNLLLTILAAYALVGILYSAIMCIRYRKEMCPTDYIRIVPWIILWPVSLFFVISLEVLFRIMMKPHEHDFLYNLIAIFAFCEWLKSLRR